MKKIFLIFIMAITLILGLNNVIAEESITGSVKITGRNTYGRTLTAEASCTKPSTECNFEYQWYSNTTNSTTGGTVIKGATSKYYVIEESLKEKYIYVVVTAKVQSVSTSNSYISSEFKDITDSTNNVTATVSDYVDIDSTTKYSADVKATYEVGANLTITLNNIVLNENNVEYYVMFVNKGESRPIMKQTNLGCEYPETNHENINKFKYVNTTTGEIVIDDDWYILDGYDYIYVVKQTSDKVNGGRYCSITKEPINIKKPSLPDLGKRYQFYVFSESEFDGLSTFPLFPYDGHNGTHTLKTKIGLIKDNSLLKKLANNSKDALSSLLEYAKKNDGTVFTYSDEHYYDNDIGSFKVTDGAYYYVYTTYDNSDGLYRDLSDVTVVMGESGMLVNDVKWTTTNPDTGIFNQYGIFGLIIIVGFGLFVIIKKYSKFPKKA